MFPDAYLDKNPIIWFLNRLETVRVYFFGH